MTTDKRNRLFWQIPFLLFLIIGTIWVLSKRHEQTIYHTNSGQIFGTQYHIIYTHDKDVKELIDKRLKEVNSVFSTFDSTSEISRINRNEPIEVSAEFVDIFSKARSISEVTAGAFDITVAPIVNAWGFGYTGNKQTRVTQSTVDSIMAFVGCNKVRLEGKRIIKADPRMLLDCSAIAKGYGCDAVAQLFDELGIKNYMIEIGGEIIVKGQNEKQRPWGIGINRPLEDSTGIINEVYAKINLTDIAMATSGNYRNYYYEGGKKYSHTIDPKTGYPVEHSILSVTVVTKECAMADGYATAFMVMGFERAKQIIEHNSDLKAFIIYEDKMGNTQTWCSPELKNMIE